MKTVYLALILDTDENVSKMFSEWLCGLPVEETRKLPLVRGLIDTERLTEEAITEMYNRALVDAILDSKVPTKAEVVE